MYATNNNTKAFIQTQRQLEKQIILPYRIKMKPTQLSIQLNL